MQVSAGSTMSLAELEAAAQEAGIDGALVRQAADDITRLPVPTRPAAAPRREVLGAPLRLSHERWVDGPVGPGFFDEISDELRAAVGHPGEIKIEGRNMSWSSSGRTIAVNTSRRGDRTLVRIEERTGELAAALHLGMGLPVAVGGLGWILPVALAVLHMPLLIPLLFIGWSGLSFLLARTIFGAIVRRRDHELATVAEEVGEASRAKPAQPALTD